MWTLDHRNAGTGREGWPSVVMLHSFYKRGVPSGENETVLDQFRSLSRHGVDVALLSCSTDELSHQSGYVLRAALTTTTGLGPSPLEHLNRLRPDILHVHNLFPNIGLQWLGSYTGTVVASLHNFRAVCANGLLSRDGHSCFECIESTSLAAIRHACYRNSRLASIPLAMRTRKGATRDKLLARADAVLAPGKEVQDLYRSLGIRNVELLYQPSSRWPTESARHEQVGGLFVGRLSEEKGIIPLLESWPESERITIVGTGPVEDSARTLASRRKLQAKFTGLLKGRDLDHVLHSAEYLVFASTVHEGAPLVYGEALAFGLPIVSIVGNAVAEMVNADGSGAIVPEFEQDAWLAGISFVRQNYVEISARNLRLANVRYSQQAWLHNLHSIYAGALDAGKAS